jgi:lysozyme
MKISQNGIDLICSFEGYSTKPYLDSNGIPTIGYGTTLYPDESRVSMSDDLCTKEDAQEWLKLHLLGLQQSLNGVGLTINQNQFDALCSFIYNVGFGAFTSSTLLKVIKGESNAYSIDECFLMWNKAGSNTLAGLTKRRQAEANLYNS